MRDARNRFKNVTGMYIIAAWEHKMVWRSPLHSCATTHKDVVGAASRNAISYHAAARKIEFIDLGEIYLTWRDTDGKYAAPFNPRLSEF